MSSLVPSLAPSKTSRMSMMFSSLVFFHLVAGDIINMNPNDPMQFAEQMKQIQERKEKENKATGDYIAKTWRVCGLETKDQWETLRSTRYDLANPKNIKSHQRKPKISKCQKHLKKLHKKLIDQEMKDLKAAENARIAYHKAADEIQKIQEDDDESTKFNREFAAKIVRKAGDEFYIEKEKDILRIEKYEKEVDARKAARDKKEAEEKQAEIVAYGDDDDYELVDDLMAIDDTPLSGAARPAPKISPGDDVNALKEKIEMSDEEWEDERRDFEAKRLKEEKKQKKAKKDDKPDDRASANSKEEKEKKKDSVDTSKDKAPEKKKSNEKKEVKKDKKDKKNKDSKKSDKRKDAKKEEKPKTNKNDAKTEKKDKKQKKDKKKEKDKEKKEEL